MSEVFKQFVSNRRDKVLAIGWVPVSLHFMPGQETLVQFSNGEKCVASCLRCYDMPCVRFSESEVIPGNFDRFPADRNLEVCAAGALSLPDDGGGPVINNLHCVFCGVCSSRCSVGAIRLIPMYGAVVNDEPNDAFIEIDHVDESKCNADRLSFKGLPFNGTQLIENDILLDEVFSRLQQAGPRVGDRFPNLLVRNLLIGAGIGASVGRKGNNHMRMDIILSSPGVSHGLAEVEFGQDSILDAPRDTLDSLAVLVSRYGWILESTTVLVVSDMLPNRRSEYWHIIQDISNVLGIKIGTVTIFLLMFYNWSRMNMVIDHCQKFYVDRDTSSYRAEVLEVAMGRKLNLSNTTRSHVDIAK